MFMRWSSCHGDMYDIIYDAEGQASADICSCEGALMGFESGAVSAWLTKHFVTIFSKICNKGI